MLAVLTAVLLSAVASVGAFFRSILVSYKTEVVTGGIVIAALVFSAGLDRYLVAAACIATFVAGFKRGG